MPLGWFAGFLVLSFVIVLFALRPKKSEKDMEKRLKVLALTLKNENDAEPEPLALTGKQSGALVEKLGEYLQQFGSCQRQPAGGHVAIERPPDAIGHGQIAQAYSLRLGGHFGAPRQLDGRYRDRSVVLRYLSTGVY